MSEVTEELDDDLSTVVVLRRDLVYYEKVLGGVRGKLACDDLARDYTDMVDAPRRSRLTVAVEGCLSRMRAYLNQEVEDVE